MSTGVVCACRSSMNRIDCFGGTIPPSLLRLSRKLCLAHAMHVAAFAHTYQFNKTSTRGSHAVLSGERCACQSHRKRSNTSRASPRVQKYPERCTAAFSGPPRIAQPVRACHRFGPTFLAGHTQEGGSCTKGRPTWSTLKCSLSKKCPQMGSLSSTSTTPSPWRRVVASSTSRDGNFVQQTGEDM